VYSLLSPWVCYLSVMKEDSSAVPSGNIFSCFLFESECIACLQKKALEEIERWRQKALLLLCPLDSYIAHVV